MESTTTQRREEKGDSKEEGKEQCHHIPKERKGETSAPPTGGESSTTKGGCESNTTPTWMEQAASKDEREEQFQPNSRGESDTFSQKEETTPKGGRGKQHYTKEGGWPATDANSKHTSSANSPSRTDLHAHTPALPLPCGPAAFASPACPPPSSPALPCGTQPFTCSKPLPYFHPASHPVKKFSRTPVFKLLKLFDFLNC